MKKELLLAILPCIVFGVIAADSTRLNVKGVLVNAACSPSLDKNEVDFGNIPISSLNKTDANQLGERNVTLTITCDNAMVMGWTTVDGRSNSVKAMTITTAAADSSNVTEISEEYGLGTVGMVNLGSFALTAKTHGVTYDGNPGDLLQADNVGNGNGTAWEKSTKGVSKSGVRTFTVGATGETTPKAFKTGIFPLKVTAAVQGTDVLQITEDTNLDGMVTISLSYI